MTQTLYPAVRYVDAKAAIAWLEDAFGAEKVVAYENDDGVVQHAEMRIAGNIFMFGEARDGTPYPFVTPERAGGVTGSIYAVLPDAATVDALHARAAKAGARIISPPNDTDYGSHDFSAFDIGGNAWTFGTYDPNAPEAP